MKTLNPKKDRNARRKRPQYPTLAPGQAVLLDREECGLNRATRFVGKDGVTQVTGQPLNQCFVFKRAPN